MAPFPLPTLWPMKHGSISLTYPQQRRENTQPFSEHQKVKFLENGLTPSELYNNQLLIWLSTHSRVDQQTFLALSTALHEWDDTLGQTTTGALGYSAAVFDAAVAAAVQAMQKQNIRNGNRPNHPSVGNSTLRPLNCGPPQYCWTHGSGHSGKVCRNPGQGHIKEASFASKMGDHT